MHGTNMKIIHIRIYGLQILRKNDSIKMELTETGLGWDVDWIDVTQDSSRWWDVVSMVINFQVPQNARNFLIICEIISLPRKNLLHEVGLRRQFYNLLQNCITDCESAH